MDIRAQLEKIVCSMLRTRTLLHRDGLELSDLACSHRHGRGACEEHRLLLRRAGEIEEHEWLERALTLAARTLEQSDPRRVAAGRPTTIRSRRALADGARELLAAEPRRSALG